MRCLERVLTQGSDAVARYIDGCRAVGFDIIELSTGFITIPPDDWLRLMYRVQEAGLRAKPEVGIQFGAGGATASDELADEGPHAVAWMIQLARRFLDAGAYQVMIESEESLRTCAHGARCACRLIDALGFDGSCSRKRIRKSLRGNQALRSGGEPVRRPHQIVQLESLRQGIWGTNSLWGRVLTYKE